jgi:hypothetical protein
MPAPTLFRYNIGHEKNVKNLIFYTSNDIAKYLDSNLLCIICLQMFMICFAKFEERK